MQEIIEGSFFAVLHHDSQSWRDCDRANQQNNIRMAILWKHGNLVIEFAEEFFIDVGVEDFLHSNLKATVSAYMDCAKPSHWNLLSNCEIAVFYLQNPIFE